MEYTPRPEEQMNDAKPQVSLESCRNMVQLILDNEATEEQKRLFKLHYESCPFCRDEYTIQSVIHRALIHNLTPVSVPKDLIGRIKSNVGID